MSAILEVAGLAKSFGGVEAVRGVDFGVAAGELLAMIGPNGAGKTTCFNMLNGQVAADSGSVRLDGREIVGRKPREIWRLGVGRTFQITATFGSMTVRENVQVALLSHRRRLADWWTPVERLLRDDADQLLERVGMLGQAGRACSVLAYGDLKRVELAVALVGEPRLLLMDEPTAGMAAAERGELMTLAAGIARERSIAVLFTEHDMDVVFAHADRVLVLHRGQLIAQGKPAEVRASARVREVYLGSEAG
ncbi:MAG TPA: ABC transporter ATP-binding protein [Burkholderiales bacterium]|nr:ABC transporter ATP-binding protein [Burkholderiales bacterium]